VALGLEEFEVFIAKFVGFHQEAATAGRAWGIQESMGMSAPTRKGPMISPPPSMDYRGLSSRYSPAALSASAEGGGNSTFA
jgi:hypothetical protein